jgi:hypothetical protein
VGISRYGSKGHGEWLEDRKSADAWVAELQSRYPNLHHAVVASSDAGFIILWREDRIFSLAELADGANWDQDNFVWGNTIKILPETEADALVSRLSAEYPGFSFNKSWITSKILSEDLASGRLKSHTPIPPEQLQS